MTRLPRRKDPNTSSRELIANVVMTRHPTTVRQLAQAVMATNTFDEVDFIRTVKAMANDGSLVIKEPSYEVESIMDYLLTATLSGWLWSTIAATVLATAAVVLIPELFPYNIIRLIVGAVFMLYLPGHTLLRLLFFKGSDIDVLERIGLGVSASLVAVCMLGLGLSFTPWGIRLGPIVASLGGFVVICTTGAAVRQYLAIRMARE
jgi:hypothetical protein